MILMDSARFSVAADIRARFQHILVDDVQGLSESQYRLIKHLWQHQGSVFFAGDDDQVGAMEMLVLPC